jgi:hypothetical protein
MRHWRLGIEEGSEIVLRHSSFSSSCSPRGFDPLPPLDESLLCSAVSKYLGHLPEGLIEFHILIDALDCPALRYPATIRAAARTVTLTTANDVLLDAVQRDKKIFGSVSITSWIRGMEGLTGALMRSSQR